MTGEFPSSQLYFLEKEEDSSCYTVDAATAGIVPYADGGWNHVWYVTAN